MFEPSECDLAQIKYEMRQIYQHVGFNGALQILYEMMIGSRCMAEVIKEERAKERKHDETGS